MPGTKVTTIWTDGDPTSYAVVVGNLNDGTNNEWINFYYPFNGTTRLIGRPIGARFDGMFRNDMKAVGPTRWPLDGRVRYRISTNRNMNIGHGIEWWGDSDDGEDPPFLGPKLIFSASYGFSDQIDGRTRVSRVHGGWQHPSGSPKDEEGVKHFRLGFILTEPLKITLSNETKNWERDGIQSATIVAEVTWKGQPIKPVFTKNIEEDGGFKEVSYEWPMPYVEFQAGEEVNKEDLAVKTNPLISLSKTIERVSLSRTTENNFHSHVTEIDHDGNGKTTEIIPSGAAYHEHVFENYVSSESMGHIHDLKSVAVVQLNPMNDPFVPIHIAAFVVYDPTGCEAPRMIGSYNKRNDLSSLHIGNRWDYADLKIKEGQVSEREFVFELHHGGSPYSAERNTDTFKGFNIRIKAYWEKYTYQDPNTGLLVTVPQEPVPDGTRVSLEIKPYRPVTVDFEKEEREKASGRYKSVDVIEANEVKEYVYLNIKGSIIADGRVYEDELPVVVRSNLSWIPYVQGLLPEPTDDDIYLNDAISQIVTIGASQINNAVRMSAQRITDYQMENVEWQEAKKTIILLTDGDENTSTVSVEQATNEVNFISGKCKTPVLPIQFGYSHSADDILMARYANDTCGENYRFIGGNLDYADQIIRNIITGEILNVNIGSFTNIVDLRQENLFGGVRIESLSIPDGARVLFRYRLSSDSKVWSGWSAWYDSSLSETFDLDLKFKARYMQYEIKLYGNEDFESPEIYAGLTTSYYRAREFKMFFQPIGLNINSDEYLASIHITHKGTIPKTSVIDYGVAQFNTINPDDYSSVTRDVVTPDRHSIMLTRYNELFIPYNSLSYVAINGGWPDDALIDIYRTNSELSNGLLLNPNEYSVNNKTGRLTFANVQPSKDKFLLCVHFDPEFRILCNVVNYGPSNLILDHIGAMYNVTRRIPRDSSGNILNRQINERLP